MNRDEAVDLLKELLDKYRSLEGKSFAIMPPDANNVRSKGYQVHIKTELDENTILQLRRYALDCGLALTEEKKNLTIIYKPMKS